MIGVLDTSALMRLFVPDGPIPAGLVEFLRGVESGQHVAIVPELLFAEAANVVLKKEKRKELSESEALEMLQMIHDLPLRSFAVRPFLKKCVLLASQTGLTAYDALFLCLAEDRGGVLFTADDQLGRIARERGLSDPEF
jgi:predicted nucleic acid-binding protein